MRISDQDLHGRVVISRDGAVIGEITKLFLTGDCQVDAVEVKLRKATAERLRTRHSLLHSATVEIPAHSIQSIGDTVILSVPIEELQREAPSEMEGPRAEPETQPRPAELAGQPRPTRSGTFTSPAPARR
jgi:sporulation protein YlmC with PRC-barrel domain